MVMAPGAAWSQQQRAMQDDMPVDAGSKASHASVAANRLNDVFVDGRATNVPGLVYVGRGSGGKGGSRK